MIRKLLLRGGAALLVAGAAWADGAEDPSRTRLLFNNYKLHRVVTADGIGLVVVELLGADGKPMSQAVPELLVHGFTSNANSWFQVASSERHRGRRVFIANWRGHGQGGSRSVGVDGTPALSDRRMSFDNVVAHDVPALLDFVYQESGRRPVHWVGHSMGGMMMHLALAGVTRDERGDMALSEGHRRFIETRLASFTAVGSPVRFSRADALERMTFDLLRIFGIDGDASAGLRGAVERLPFGPMFRDFMQDSLYHSSRWSVGMEGVLNTRNISLQEFRLYHSFMGSQVPSGLIESAFGAKTQGYTSADGRVNYEELSMKGPATPSRIPVVLVGAQYDQIATPESLAEAARQRGLPLHTVADAGHIDLLLGHSLPQLARVLDARGFGQACRHMHGR